MPYLVAPARQRDGITARKLKRHRARAGTRKKRRRKGVESGGCEENPCSAAPEQRPEQRSTAYTCPNADKNSKTERPSPLKAVGSAWPLDLRATDTDNIANPALCSFSPRDPVSVSVANLWTTQPSVFRLDLSYRLHPGTHSVRVRCTQIQRPCRSNGFQGRRLFSFFLR